jgi:TonB family protein
VQYFIFRPNCAGLKKLLRSTQVLQQFYSTFQLRLLYLLIKSYHVKFFIPFILLSICITAAAQKKEIFYDYSWKPTTIEKARFYSTIEKTDSGCFRQDFFLGTKSLQMQGLYEDADCKSANGTLLYFHANGKPSVVGKMVHNKQEGICVRYFSNGMIADSAMYNNGKVVGNRIMWHRNGFMSDSLTHINDSMDVYLGWFDDGAIAFAGHMLRGKQHGKWQYFHHNGNISSNESYKNGIAISKEYFTEEGPALKDTSKANRPTLFAKGGDEGWKKYLEKSLYWPDGFKITNSNAVVVLVEMTINEEGKPEDVEVTIPFHPEFDRIALKVIRNSPAWTPGIAHNRKIKSRFRQPVTFMQQE